jgi:hypothetical protein
MFWERQSRAERAEALREIQTTLRNHHHEHAGPNPHPLNGFLVPQWNGPTAFSAVALQGSVPVWDL